MIQAVTRVMDQQLDERYRSTDSVARSAGSVAPRIACDDIMAVAIALVSNQEIQLMSREDMLDALRAAQGVPRSPARVERITDFDDNTLRRVTHLVRRWMRIRVNELSKEKGWTPYFRDHF